MNRIVTIIIALLVCISSFGQYAPEKTLSLEECIDRALSSSVSVENARLDTESARNDRMIAFSKYFPQVNLMSFGFMAMNPIIRYGISDIKDAGLRNEIYNLWYNEGQTLNLPKNFTAIEKGAIVGVSAVQPVFAGGQIVAGNALSKVGIEAAELKEVMARRDLLLEVEESYFLVNSLQSKRQTVVSALALIDTVERCVSTAVKAGVATSSDALKVKVRRKEMSSNLESLDDGIALAMQALCRITGIDYDPSLTLSDTLLLSPEPPYDLYVSEEQAVNSRPETQLLNLNVKAQTLQKRMTTGAALPTVAVGGSFAYINLLERNDHNAIAFFVVKVPITAWWENSHRIKKSNIAIQKAQNTLSDTEKLLSLQTLKVWNELLKAWRDLELKNEVIEDVEANYRNVLSKYNAGYATTAELLEAQLMLQKIDSERCDALIAYALKKREYLNYTR